MEGQVPLCRKVAALHKLLRSGERLCKHHACTLPGRTFWRPVSACFSRLPRGGLVLLARASAEQSTYEYSTVSLTMQHNIMLLALCSPCGARTEDSSRAKERPSRLVVLAIRLKPERRAGLQPGRESTWGRQQTAYVLPRGLPPWNRANLSLSRSDRCYSEHARPVFPTTSARLP